VCNGFLPSQSGCSKRAVELAQLYNAKLTLIHVVEYFPEDRSNIQIASEDADPMHFREQEALEAMHRLVQQIGSDEVEKIITFSSHSARYEIIRYTEEHKMNLIVIASHGHHGITSILGSISNGVVHNSPCDVLVVRAYEK
jgi:universal stress protein A